TMTGKRRSLESDIDTDTDTDTPRSDSDSESIYSDGRWRPLVKRLYFNLPRKLSISQQNHRCATCGKTISSSSFAITSSPRFCEVYTFFLCLFVYFYVYKYFIYN